jgi:hypothetical protein
MRLLRRGKNAADSWLRHVGGCVLLAVPVQMALDQRGIAGC